MKYRVTFVERTDGRGNPSENPPEFVEPELTDGIVLDAVFVERFEPDNLNNEEVMEEEVMEEDDSFLSIGTEVWEYDIADGRDREFIDALMNSKMVLEYETLEDEPSTQTLS